MPPPLAAGGILQQQLLACDPNALTVEISGARRCLYARPAFCCALSWQPQWASFNRGGPLSPALSHGET